MDIHTVGQPNEDDLSEKSMTKEVSDWNLLRRYVREIESVSQGGKSGEAAFSQIAKRHVTFVYNVCLREVKDEALAEEVTQAVFLVLARKAPSLRPKGLLTTWLFSVARMTCRNAMRDELRRQRREKAAVMEIIHQKHVQTKEAVNDRSLKEAACPWRVDLHSIA